MITEQRDRETGRGTGRYWYVAAAYIFAVGMAGTTLPTPLYGLYRQQLGFSQLMVTVVFAVYAVGVIVALLLAGNVSDRVGRRPVLLTALSLSAASAGCFLLEDGLPWLFTGRVLSGFSAGLFSGAATAAVLELAPEGRQARAGLAATAANMGGLGCGPLLAGTLAQYAPGPLKLPFLTHLGLLAVAAAVTLVLPETVPVARANSARTDGSTDGSTGGGANSGRGLRGLPRPQGIKVPPQVRPVFLPAALASFAGFSTLGLFTAVAPSFLHETLRVDNLAVSGAVVFVLFCASTVGQSLMNRVGERRGLPYGCLVLVVGMLLVAASLALRSLPVLVAGAVIGGAGQGLAFRSGLTAVGRQAPPDRRGGTISAFFVVAYTGISLPVVGVGALTVTLGLRNAGMVFASCVVLVVATVAAYLLRRDREH